MSHLANRKTAHFILAVGLCTSFTSPGFSQTKSILGTGRAKDGDSLMVGNVEVRLFGVDAPELDQLCKRGSERWQCGTAAKEELANLVTGKLVFCAVVDTDQYGRKVSRCSVGGVDINRTLVALGYAVAYRRYSMDYVAAEERAKTGKLGLWAGTFELPSQYRQEERTVASVKSRRAPTASSSGSTPRPGCVIKGNRNRKGQWIYHLPGMPYYEQTRPEEIFCTEADAKAAGYRRAVVK